MPTSPTSVCTSASCGTWVSAGEPEAPLFAVNTRLPSGPISACVRPGWAFESAPWVGRPAGAPAVRGEVGGSVTPPGCTGEADPIGSAGSFEAGGGPGGGGGDQPGAAV